jgi:membrane-bound metal-dependent hydrolase YbcI (DUF457 family)
VATPIGHSLMGLLIARRLGVTSPSGLAAAVVAASLPDTDVIAGMVLHRDPWKLHRKVTHEPGFALVSGALFGAAGLLRAGNLGGERDVIADGMTGALLVGSHVVLDRAPVPYPDTRNLLVRGVTSLVIDSLLYGAIAYALWPRERRTTA